MRAGRDLELLVARLEHVLAGHDEVAIESPAYLPGKDSGTSREVDVAVRGRLGSHRVLIILECRDRSGAEDVTWIEQVATKRKDVGANVAVAVSSSGFSAAARNMATANWIELRTVEQLTGADVLSWLRIATIECSGATSISRRSECRYRQRLRPRTLKQRS